MMGQAMYDDRLNRAWDSWRSSAMAVEPDKAMAEFAFAFKPFVAGWHARIDAATNSWDTSDEALIRDEFSMFDSGYKRIFEHMVDRVDFEKKQTRTIEQLREQVRAIGGNPDDAPAYQRIANQRRELKASRKAINEMRQVITDLQCGSSGSEES